MRIESLNDEIESLKEKIDSLAKENETLKEYAARAEKDNIFEFAPDAMILFNKGGYIIDANRAFCTIVGKEIQDVIGHRLEGFIAEESLYKLNRQQELLEQGGRAKGILPIRHAKGISYLESVTSYNEKLDLYLSVLREVTHKTILGQKIKENEKLFQELFLEAMDGIIFWDMEGTIINANASACRIFECAYHELIGRNFKDLSMDRHRNPPLFKIMKEFRSTGAVKEQLFFRMADGREKLLEFSCRMHSVDGFHMTIFRDISDRHRMEQELRDSEQIFRIIFEEALDGLILWNKDFKVIDVNSAAINMLSVEKKQLVGQFLQELITDCEFKKQELSEHVRQVIRNGKHASSITLDCRDGQKRHFEFSTQHALVAGLNLTVFKDVSERIQMQEQLRKSDTLNVLGELAAGIAHEIRNPMTALKGFIQLLEESIKEEHSMYYQVITSELQRIDSIINEFLILAKPQAVRFQEKDVVLIMKETLDLLNAQAVLHNVQFLMVPEKEIPPIVCEPNQLKKVFINIIKNAIEVMPDGGTVTIKMGRKENMIHISIKDEGMGIPKEKIPKLGEPFYTTKERGTGLGLMVSFKIVEEHQGKIEIESELGNGAEFHICLPLQKTKANQDSI